MDCRLADRFTEHLPVIGFGDDPPVSHHFRSTGHSLQNLFAFGISLRSHLHRELELKLLSSFLCSSWFQHATSLHLNTNANEILTHLQPPVSPSLHPHSFTPPHSFPSPQIRNINTHNTIQLSTHIASYYTRAHSHTLTHTFPFHTH